MPSCHPASDLFLRVSLSHHPFVFLSLFMQRACTFILWHRAHFTQFPAPKWLSPHSALILSPWGSGGNLERLSVNPCFRHRKKHTHTFHRTAQSSIESGEAESKQICGPVSSSQSVSETFTGVNKSTLLFDN